MTGARANILRLSRPKPMTRYVALVDGQAGAYGVVFPDLPGCTAMGATVETALVNAADSLRNWAAVMGERSLPMPAPQPMEVLRRQADVTAALAEGACLATVALVRETGKPVKANLSIDEGVLAAIDCEAARLKLSRSAFIEFMAKRALAELA
jgi:predicted RNase H-like HicB family nuclease